MLNLGIAREIITPKLGCQLYGYPQKPSAESVHDDLTTTAYVFTNNGKKMLLSISTICALRQDIAHDLRTEISEKFDIPYENIVLATVHTHTGPCYAGMFAAWGTVDEDNFENTFKPGLFSSIEKALENIEPVTVATSSGISHVGINRRELDFENNVILGENEWGPYNPKMTVISFKDAEGSIKANLISYGAHGTSAGIINAISRDWSGIMTDAVEEKFGGYADLLLGPEGDVAPRKAYKNERGSIKQLEAVGAMAANDAIKILDTITDADYKDVDMSVNSDTLKIPVKPRPAYEEVCAKIKEFDLDNMTTMDSVKYSNYVKIKEEYENSVPEKKYDEISQVVFRIGDVAFAVFTYELFSEIGLRIAKAFDDINVSCIVIANGQNGYFPTQSQLCLGGYEITMFRARFTQEYVDDADYHLVMETIRNVKSVID